MNEAKLPVNVKKMMQSLNNMEVSIHEQKDKLNNMEKEFHKFKKYSLSFIEFSKKQLEKKPRQPSGFQLPVSLSNELCDFLGLDHDSKLPRTEVTKMLIKYISDNQLINPEKKNTDHSG
jgi:chromatin remodeling complex protein RSC6